MKKFSFNDLSYMEEMKSKLKNLNSIYHTTNAMIVQFNLHQITNNTKHSLIKKRTLLHQSIPNNNLSTIKRLSNNIDFKSSILHSNHIVSVSPNLNSPINDEFFTDDSHISESSHQNYRISDSITSSSSPSKTSHDEPPLAPDTLIIGKLYILNEIYPSIESEHLINTPLAFLSSDKFLRIHIDWTKIQYPLSSYYIEIILDLILRRPSFIREIPKITKFNFYRPLIQTISGHLFFDHEKHKAGVHQCHQKLINHKFTIKDLASIHRREFNIINYNAIREQRFINLYENLSQIYIYQTKSNQHI